MPSDISRLDDADRALLRECPFTQFVPVRGARGAAAQRIERLRRLAVRGYIRGRIEKDATDGYDYRLTLTANGREALGLPPEAPPS